MINIEENELKQILNKLQFYARRYCNGRMTYATAELNQITARLVEAGIPLQIDTASDNRTDMDPSTQNTIWAFDGMESCCTARNTYVEKYGKDGKKNRAAFPY